MAKMNPVTKSQVNSWSTADLQGGPHNGFGHWSKQVGVMTQRMVHFSEAFYNALVVKRIQAGIIAHTHTHTHIPVSYTHLTLPTIDDG